MLHSHLTGFTLAELLIALAILAEIATFTIPKILASSQHQQKNSVTKEVIATISSAYSQYQLNGTVSTTTYPQQLTQYMNYVSIDTTSQMDTTPGGLSRVCGGSSSLCLRLHNGALVYFPNSASYFYGTGSTNFIWFQLDPDGGYTGNADSIIIVLYYNGRVTSYGNLVAGSVTGSSGSSYSSAPDPSWFSW